MLETESPSQHALLDKVITFAENLQTSYIDWWYLFVQVEMEVYTYENCIVTCSVR